MTNTKISDERLAGLDALNPGWAGAMVSAMGARKRRYADMGAPTEQADADFYAAAWLADNLHAIKSALASRHQEPVEPAVKVKPLEWSSEPPYSVARVSSLRLLYSTEAVWDEGVFQYVELRGGFASGDFPTVEEAKAAAQADYEQRIRSVIEVAPQPAPVVTDELETTYRRGHLDGRCGGTIATEDDDWQKYAASLQKQESVE